MAGKKKKLLKNLQKDLDKATRKHVKKRKSAHGSSGKETTKSKQNVRESRNMNLKNAPTLDIKTDSEIAMDFATKVYQRFNKMVKSAVLFGSVAKQESVAGSDIDVMILIDDATIRFDQELIAWYREELEKLVRANPYKKNLHITTIKLTTWWEDLLRGDPVVLNIIREGETLIDFGGFFEPLKFLLVNGKIKATPEAVYSLLQRAPEHVIMSKLAELNSVEGLYWAMVDSAQAALVSVNVQPSSPEHIPIDLKEYFVNQGKLKMKYVIWYRDLLMLHKKIIHREITDLKGIEIDDWQEKTDEFIATMAQLVKDTIGG